MDDTEYPAGKRRIKGVFLPRIDEGEAKRLTRVWIESQPFSKKSSYRLGKAVMVYYPYWEFVREDGAETKTFYRPACGTLMTDLQKLTRTTVPSSDIPDDLNTLPITIDASYYHLETHGIPRGERLVAIPFWLISYKMEKSIYMLKIDAETGAALPEWHPFKESTNWKRIATIAFIPLILISFAAVIIHPILFILDLAVVIFFLYQSRMFALINMKREEGDHGT